jgi:hypothetical protein
MEKISVRNIREQLRRALDEVRLTLRPFIA